MALSSDSDALLERSRGGEGEADVLSCRETAGAARVCDGGGFVEFEPAGEELLASRWSNAFKAIALEEKMGQ